MCCTNEKRHELLLSYNYKHDKGSINSMLIPVGFHSTQCDPDGVVMEWTIDKKDFGTTINFFSNKK